MVTYLVKQQYGAVRLHSAEGSQLEAYCSAIGKILLAGLSDEELNRYAAEGDFVRLTCNTIVEPHLLLDEIELVRKRGWAVDAEEITMGLHCVAVPISDRAGKTVAAASISNVVNKGTFEVEASLPGLMEAACEIGQRLFPH
jgi:DNA-binding IclR family transcriptional regulator